MTACFLISKQAAISLLRDQADALFAQNGLLLPTNITEAASAPVIYSLLQQGTTVAIVPAHAVQSACQAGELTALIRNIPLGSGAFGLITRSDHPLTPEAQLLLKTLRELAVATAGNIKV